MATPVGFELTASDLEGWRSGPNELRGRFSDLTTPREQFPSVARTVVKIKGKTSEVGKDGVLWPVEK